METLWGTLIRIIKICVVILCIVLLSAFNMYLVETKT
jgi:hypothetical protein